MLEGQECQPFSTVLFIKSYVATLESLIDVGQGISVVPGRFGKKNKRMAWKIWKKNNHRAGKI